jgi:hypothetical protein
MRRRRSRDHATSHAERGSRAHGGTPAHVTVRRRGFRAGPGRARCGPDSRPLHRPSALPFGREGARSHVLAWLRGMRGVRRRARADGGPRRGSSDRCPTCGWPRCGDGDGHGGRRRGGRRIGDGLHRGRRPGGHRRRLRGGRARGKELQWVQVAVGIGGHANAEMDVRAVVLGLAGPPQGSDLLPLDNGCSARHGDGAEMEQRDGVPVGGLEGDRTAVKRQGPCEAHDARRRRHDRLAAGASDVHAAMLARLVLARAHDERTQHRAGRGPAPGARARGERQRDRDGRGNGCSRLRCHL